MDYTVRGRSDYVLCHILLTTSFAAVNAPGHCCRDDIQYFYVNDNYYAQKSSTKNTTKAMPM
nr:ORF39 [Bracoviriform inaniti]